MEKWTMKDLKKKYDIDFASILEKINSEKAKRVLLQFPDGLKQYATAVVDYLEEKSDAEFFIWMGNCFGACDTPQGIEKLDIDLMVQIGHNSLMPCYLR